MEVTVLQRRYKNVRLHNDYARRVGAEVAGWTLDRKIRVRFPAYPHRVWALWWQGGKRRLRTSRCPCRGRLGTLKTHSCPWRGCPAAGQNLETWHLSRLYIAEILLNVTLNLNQQHNDYGPAEDGSWGDKSNLTGVVILRITDPTFPLPIKVVQSKGLALNIFNKPPYRDQWPTATPGGEVIKTNTQYNIHKSRLCFTNL